MTTKKMKYWSSTATDLAIFAAQHAVVSPSLLSVCPTASEEREDCLLVNCSLAAVVVAFEVVALVCQTFLVEIHSSDVVVAAAVDDAKKRDCCCSNDELHADDSC